MKIGTYISELLFDHDHVILPGFGEFSTKYIPARFLPEEKKILSPAKIISFSSENTEGETPLLGHIAKKENLSIEQVQKLITDFVAEFKGSMASGQKVVLNHVGVFSQDFEGNFSFEPDKSINYLADAAGLGAVTEPPKTTATPVITPVSKAVSEKKPEPVFEKEPEPLPKFEKPVEPSVSAEPDTEKTPEPQVHFTDTTRQDLPKGIKWLAWFFIPIIVVLIILAFNWRFIFGKSTQAPAPRPQIETVAPAPVAEQPVETPAPEVQEAPATTPAPAVAATPAQPEAGRRVYYIVVGAFQDEGQANRYVEELRSKGAQQASIFMQTSTGFHRVCYGFYYDQAEADAQLSRVQQDINSSAWILQRN